MAVNAAELAERIAQGMDGVVVDARPISFGLTVALLARGHVLIEGVPGTGKTLAVRALAKLLGLPFRRIQFTPDMMPADVVGTAVFNPQTAQFSTRPGPIVTNVVLADEINRTPPKTQAALLEAMEEGRVTIDGVPLALPLPFLLCATQNPIEYEGTYPLPEAQLDRFMVKIESTYPSEQRELELLERVAGGFDARDLESSGIVPVTNTQEIVDAQQAIRQVHLAAGVRQYAYRIVAATRQNTRLTLGGSPRAGVALLLASQAASAIAGRDFATPDDIKDVAPFVLPHRLIVAPDAEIEGITARDVLREFSQAYPFHGTNAMTWVTRRFLYLLGGIVVLLACSPGLPILVPISEALGALLIAALVVDALLGPRQHQLHVSRVPIGHLALRRPADFRYIVENRSARAIAVTIAENPTRTLRFTTNEAIGDVPAQSEATIGWSAVPVARGEDAVQTLYVTFENSLGLMRRRMKVDAPERFRVFPDLSAVERYGSLHVRNRLIEAGLRKMRLRGSGTEFESLREFADGDPFRSIDWKATARRGKVMVAQYEVERSQNLMLVLDCGRLMTPRIGDQRKLDYAVTAALSLATIAGLASDRVGVVAFAGKILAASAPRSTRSSIAKLTELLYDLEPRFEEANYARAFAYLRAHLHKRSLIVFLTDVIDPVSQATVFAELGSLAHRHLVLCVFMNDAAITHALATPPHDDASAYRASVALDLLDERKTAAAMLTRTGAVVLDVPAEKLSTALIDEYLRVKQRGLL